MQYTEDYIIRLAFIDMPEIGNGLDGQKAELKRFTRRPGVLTRLASLVSNDVRLHLFLAGVLNGANVEEKTTPGGRRAVCYTIVITDENVSLWKDTSVALWAIREGKSCWKDGFGRVIMKFRCAVERLLFNDIDGLFSRAVYSPDCEEWFRDEQSWTEQDGKERDRSDFAENPPLEQIIDDNVGRYIIKRVANGE
jgi:hypothetical protein